MCRLDRAIWVSDLGDDIKAEIGRLRLSGLSYRQIAAQLHISVGSVSGHIARSLKPDAVNTRKGNRGIARKPRRRMGPVRNMPIISTRIMSPPVTGGIDLEEVNDSTCRWPITDDLPHRFCGATPMIDKKYCEHHERIAHKGRAAA